MTEIPLVTTTYNVFEIFKEVSEYLNTSKLVEVSVKQSQITLIFDKDIIELPVFKKLSNIDKFCGTSIPYFTSLNDVPMFIVPETGFEKEFLIENMDKNVFLKMFHLINVIAEKICTCPSLEILFSDTYLKCYLDKPGLMVNDLREYEKLFNLEGSLELHAQRPYLLFIKEERK